MFSILNVYHDITSLLGRGRVMRAGGALIVLHCQIGQRHLAAQYKPEAQASE